MNSCALRRWPGFIANDAMLNEGTTFRARVARGRRRLVAAPSREPEFLQPGISIRESLSTIRPLIRELTSTPCYDHSVGEYSDPSLFQSVDRKSIRVLLLLRDISMLFSTLILE